MTHGLPQDEQVPVVQGSEALQDAETDLFLAITGDNVYPWDPSDPESVFPREEGDPLEISQEEVAQGLDLLNEAFKQVSSNPAQPES